MKPFRALVPVLILAAFMLAAFAGRVEAHALHERPPVVETGSAASGDERQPCGTPCCRGLSPACATHAALPAMAEITPIFDARRPMPEEPPLLFSGLHPDTLERPPRRSA